MDGLHPSREGANPSRRTSFFCGIRPSAGRHVANVERPERHRYTAPFSLPLKHRKRCTSSVRTTAGRKSSRRLQFCPRSSGERASLCEGEGRRCDSCRGHHFLLPRRPIVGLRILDPGMMVRIHLRQPLEDEPDKRAGTASKADRTLTGLGSMPSVFRQLFCLTPATGLH